MGEFWGLTADGWIAIATFFTGMAFLIGIVIGSRQFFREQEARDVRGYYVENGTRKLAAAIDVLLETIRLNFAGIGQLSRKLRDYALDSPGAPGADDLPRLLTLEGKSVGFDAIRPVSSLLNSDTLSSLATHAFATLFNVHLKYLLEIEQPIRSYFAGSLKLDDGRRKQLANELMELAFAEFNKAESFGKLPWYIERAGVRVLQIGVTRWKEVTGLHRDLQMQAIVANVEQMWEDLGPKQDGPT